MFGHINWFIELDVAVEAYTYSLNCELDKSMTYGECAEFFDNEAKDLRNNNNADSLSEMANMLRHAEKRCFELES